MVEKEESGSPVSLGYPRGEESVSSKVDLGTLAPPLADYLSSACVLHQALASKLSTLAGGAWGFTGCRRSGFGVWSRDGSLPAFSDAPAGLCRGCRRRGGGSRERLAAHLDRVESARWYEGVGTAYVVTGFTRDFWHRLAEGFDPRVTGELQDILADRGDEDLLAGVLERFLAVDEKYSSRLSLWCRRLVGDTMLICRDALAESAMAEVDAEVRLEPVLTDVVALHTRRLDRLGLTA